MYVDLSNVQWTAPLGLLIGLWALYYSICLLKTTRWSVIAATYMLACGFVMWGRVNAILLDMGLAYPGMRYQMTVNALLVQIFLFAFIYLLQRAYHRSINDVEAALTLESAAHGIVQVSVDGLVNFANPAFKHMTGFEDHDIIGKPLTNLMPERYRDRHASAMAQYLRTGIRTLDWSNIQGHMLTVRGDELSVHIALAEIAEGKGGKGFVGIIRPLLTAAQQIGPMISSIQRRIGRRIEFLLIEDNSDDQELFRRAFPGAATHPAEWPILGIAAIDEEPTRYDAVVVDQNLPGMSGIETIREIRRRWPNLFVVMSSGLQFDDLALTQVSELKVYMLSKPLKPEACLQLIETLGRRLK